jgi:hypothetical protein
MRKDQGFIKSCTAPGHAVVQYATLKIGACMINTGSWSKEMKDKRNGLEAHIATICNVYCILFAAALCAASNLTFHAVFGFGAAHPC